MSIKASIEIILDEYPKASQQAFKENPAAIFLRNDFPEEVASLIEGDERYQVEGSAGRGVWTKVPWLAIFDITVTSSAQDGYYIVFLFKEDFSGVYLSLNQGVTTVKEQYGAEAKEALRARSQGFLAVLGDKTRQMIKGQLDLVSSESSGLGTYYEHGNICAIYYERNELPTDDVFRRDLKTFLSLYKDLVLQDLHPSSISREEDESELGTEQLIVLRDHKRLERNNALAKKAKKIHGFSCQACGFDFVKAYGSIGENFIEAHHLTPLSELKGHIVTLDPRKDFCVLCANCHRMIHRTLFIGNIYEFAQTHIVPHR
ncbi:MrcB family domain-containing protein [Edaphobacter flagellatus]|uniref:MrcB family domain-containing protein n=1 Tax=Edaphobacter flagellatus TaxID=1933044 RepID=UPI0021B3B09B|nr:DUF3578 domain-containing protein [Edaphobacter flagellatus]